MFVKQIKQQSIMKKKVLIFVGILCLAGFGIYQYAYKPQRNIGLEKPDFDISVPNLELEFVKSDSLANLKFLDKTISIYGKITNIDLKTNSIVLDDKVYVTFIAKKNQTQQSIGTAIKIKGRFIGYDDLVGEFRFDQAVLVN